MSSPRRSGERRLRPGGQLPLALEEYAEAPPEEHRRRRHRAADQQRFHPAGRGATPQRGRTRAPGGAARSLRRAWSSRAPSRR